jgi:hypothetical protein
MHYEIKRKLFLKHPYHVFESILQASNSKHLGVAVLFVTEMAAKCLNLKKIHPVIRKFISHAQPKNPLSNQNLPEINIAIPCHAKDFPNLGLVIQSAVESVKNPIREIQLITPREFTQQLRVRFPSCKVFSDDEILTSKLEDIISKKYPQDKRGWVSQQVIKFRVVMLSNCVATLILDSDTILIQQKVWIDKNLTQVLELAFEFHKPYKTHLARFLNEKTSLFSFVTHHQLMKKDVVAEIFGEAEENLAYWLECGDSQEPSPISEYDTYGEWMFNRRRRDFVVSKWNNLSEMIPQEELTDPEILKTKYGKFASVSNHSYLN